MLAKTRLEHQQVMSSLEGMEMDHKTLKENNSVLQKENKQMEDDIQLSEQRINGSND